MQLSVEDRQSIVNTLKDQDTMATESGRREILEFAGLGQVRPLLDVSGAPLIAVNKIVTFLEAYGRLNYENESLGLFLNAMKQVIGIEQQTMLNSMLIKYDMMEPIAARVDVSDWKSTDTPDTIAEKIFGENNLRPVAFLTRGIKAAKAVAYVSVRSGADRWSGTGFLCTPNLFITNHHVVPDSTLLPNVLVRFNYEEDFDGKAQPVEEYDAEPEGPFYANQELDFAIFRVQRDPGMKWGYLPLNVRDVRKGERINIIQHPNGTPKRISLQNNVVEYVGGNVLQYVTSTNPGSSGSPVLNDGWDVVGLHHAGGLIPEPTTRKSYNRNEGVLITAILDHLPREVREQLLSVGA